MCACLLHHHSRKSHSYAVDFYSRGCDCCCCCVYSTACVDFCCCSSVHCDFCSCSDQLSHHSHGDARAAWMARNYVALCYFCLRWISLRYCCVADCEFCCCREDHCPSEAIGCWMISAHVSSYVVFCLASRLALPWSCFVGHETTFVGVVPPLGPSSRFGAEVLHSNSISVCVVQGWATGSIARRGLGACLASKLGLALPFGLG
jgi:hypothetical protein